MGLYDTDPEVTGRQAEGQPFDGAPIVIGGKDDSGNVKTSTIDDSGRLRVIQASLVPPVGANPFTVSIPDADLSFITTNDYDGPLVPNGETLFLQLALAGSELDGSGNRVDLIWVEGAGATEHLIERFFAHGPSQSYILNDIDTARDGTVLTGNGSNTFLRIRRVRLSGSAMQCDVSVRGYRQ